MRLLTLTRTESSAGQPPGFKFDRQHRHSHRKRLATTYTAETLELLVETAKLRLTADGEPFIDTLRVIRNAHSVWHRLCDDDPETDLEFAAPLLALLQGHPRRTGDVIEWATSRRPA